MAFSIRTVRNGIVNTIAQNNTATSSYDVSTGLQTRVRTIAQGNPDITPLGLTVYPYVLVQPESVKETPYAIGSASTKRDAEIAMKIFCGTELASSRTNSEDEIYRLSENIETLLRNNIDMSSTASWIESWEVNYGTDEVEEILVHSAEITVKMHVIGTS